MYAKSVGVPQGYTSEVPWPQLTGDGSDGGRPHCLCNPCVISMPLDFLVGHGPPHLRNAEERYTLYRKFWQMFTNMRLRSYPMYLSKKAGHHILPLPAGDPIEMCCEGDIV